MPNATILVVDDEPLIRWSLSERLKSDGYEVLEAETGRAALEKLPEGVDLVLLDYRLPDTDGVTVLRKIKEFDQDILVILLTAYASVETAVEAMKLGAYHFANKPFNLDEVAATVERALETTRLRREVRQFRTHAARPYSLQRLVGASPAVTTLRHLVARVAVTPSSTVLLTGESGTGKDLVAKIIHYSSDRASRPFMNITCSALPEQLLESELFGHERGAFTDARTQKKGLLETADGGTVFLDEIGEMTPALQAKLLRFLEEKSFKRVGGSVDIRVDVRVIAATNRNLDDEVTKQRFRSDLFYRLNVLPVQCRRCGHTPRTFRSWSSTSSMRSIPSSGSVSSARHRPRTRCCSAMDGRATCENFATSSNGPCCSRTAIGWMRGISRPRNGGQRRRRVRVARRGSRPRAAGAKSADSGAPAQRRQPDPCRDPAWLESRPDSVPD